MQQNSLKREADQKSLLRIGILKIILLITCSGYFSVTTNFSLSALHAETLVGEYSRSVAGSVDGSVDGSTRARVASPPAMPKPKPAYLDSLLDNSANSITEPKKIELTRDTDSNFAAAHNSMIIGLWTVGSTMNDSAALKVAKYYATLYNSGQLPFKNYFDTKGRFIQEILRDEGLFFGNGFPEIVDSIMCDVNAHICDRVRVPAQPKALNDLASHVGGFLPSKGRWKNGLEDEVKIPAIKFEKAMGSVIYEKKSGEAVEAILEKTAGCGDLDLNICKNNLYWYNSSEDLSLNSEGKIIVPSDGRESDIQIFPTPRAEFVNYQKAPDFNFESVNIVDIKRQLGPSLFLPATASSQSSIQKSTAPHESTMANEPEASRISTVWELMRHPLTHIEPNGDLLSQFQLGHTKMSIYDLEADFNHCEFRNLNISVCNATGKCSDRPADSALRENRGIIAKSTEAEAPECGTVGKALYKDHGTHVLGLIGAAVNNAGVAGIIGPLSSKLKLQFVITNPTSLQSASDRKAMHDALLTGFGGTAHERSKVINFSAAYSEDLGAREPDNFTRLLGNLQSVIVAAAGNLNKNVDVDGCGHFPACITSDNIVSVVGVEISTEGGADDGRISEYRRRNILERAGDCGIPSDDVPNESENVLRVQRWSLDNKKGSDYGKRRHDIAAFSKEILSTIRDHRIGYLSGTSQAAPMVSGGLAMLGMLRPHSPRDLRDRLVYTGQLLPRVREISEGGLMDIGRMLAVDDASIVGFDGRKVTGRLVSARYADKQFSDIVIIRANGKHDFVNIRDLKRISYNAQEDNWTIFYINDAEDLIREDNVTFQNLDIFGHYRKTGNRELGIDVGKSDNADMEWISVNCIKEYYAEMHK